MVLAGLPRLRHQLPPGVGGGEGGPRVTLPLLLLVSAVTVCSVHYAVVSGQWTVCSVQCAVCSVQCAVCSVQCAVCSV